MRRLDHSSFAALSRSAVVTTAALTGILVCGAIVRLIGIDSGRPFAYHPDEWILFKSAMRMVHQLDWNPHIYWYPSLLIDMQAALTAALRMFGGPSLVTNQAWLFDTELLPVQFLYLLGGRLLVLGLGLATVVVAFGVGRLLRGPIAGLVAAALLATMPLHISDSRHLTTDVPLALFCALTLFATVKASAGGRDRWWLMAGIAAGLAASTKWTGLLVLGVPLFGYMLAEHDVSGIRARIFRRQPYVMIAAALVALVVTTPGVLLDFSTVVGSIQSDASGYGQTRAGMPNEVLFLNLKGLAAGLGPVTTVVALLGVLRCLVRPRRRVELTIPAFVFVTMVVVSLPARQFDRNMIPILPYLAVAAACFLADIPDIVRRALGRLTRRGIGGHVHAGVVAIIAIALAGCVGFGIRAGIASGAEALNVDTRTIARDWLLANVARKTVIARERETPLLTPDEYRLRPRKYLATRPLQWFRDAGTQLLVTSSIAYDRIHQSPATPELNAWYRTLLTLPEVFRIDPGPNRRGPTIRIFELAPFTRVGGGS